jgi:hypothetical protein
VAGGGFVTAAGHIRPRDVDASGDVAIPQLKGIEMTKLILGALALIATLTLTLIQPPASQAGPVPSHHGDKLLQSTNLQATRTLHTWESKPVAGVFYLNVVNRAGRVLTQAGVAPDGCAASYVGHGIVLRLVMRRCNGAGAHPIRVTYASISTPQHIHVMITRYRLV